MRKLFSFMLILVSITLIGSTQVYAKGIKFKLEENVVLSKKKSLEIYKDANENSGLMGYLDKYHSAIKDKETEEKDGFIKIVSEDVEGWVKKNNLIDTNDVNDYILKHLNKFDTTVKTNSIKGLYVEPELINDFELDYDSYCIFSKKDTKLYRTPTVSSKRKDFFDEKSYVRVNVDSAKILTNPSEGGVVWGLSSNGTEFKNLELIDDYYKVPYQDGEAYINKDDVEEFIKKEAITNIADDKFKLHQMYEYTNCKENNKFIEVVFNDRVRYVKKDDIDIVFIAKDDSSSRDIVDKSKVLELASLADSYVTVNVKNTISDTTVPLYMDINDNDFLVKLGDARKYEPPVSNYTYNGYGDDPNERNRYNNPTVDVNKFKERYNYDYANNSTEERNEIVNKALEYLGNPYVYGGTSLEHGIDCSAFCQAILQMFGKTIGRSTAIQVSESAGRTISIDAIQPGDLIYYSRNGVTPYHVVMYIGGDKCVNASCPSEGICISTIKFDRILKVKNYID